MQSFYNEPFRWGVTDGQLPKPPKCACGKDGYTVHGVLMHLEDNTPAGQACDARKAPAQPKPSPESTPATEGAEPDSGGVSEPQPEAAPKRRGRPPKNA